MKTIFCAFIALLLAAGCQYPVEEPVRRGSGQEHDPWEKAFGQGSLRPLPPSQEATARHAGQPVPAEPAQERPAQAGPHVKVYKVHYSDPAEIAGILPHMVPSADGLSVEAIDRKLVVRGTGEQHAVVRELLRDLDAPPKNIRVDVNFNTSGGSYDREIGVRQQGPIVIDRGGVHGSLRGSLRNQSNTSRENTTQMLVAADGRSASLRVGEQVPHITWLTEYGRRHGYVREVGIEWRDVGSFLAMEPTIISPGVVRIRLIPELSGRLENGDRQRIQFTHLATEVVVGNGQTISIGGFSKDKDFSSRFLVGRSSRGESSITDITLTPRILE